MKRDEVKYIGAHVLSALIRSHGGSNEELIERAVVMTRMFCAAVDDAVPNADAIELAAANEYERSVHRQRDAAHMLETMGVEPRHDAPAEKPKRTPKEPKESREKEPA